MRSRAAPLPPRHADGHRAAPSAALRRGRRACSTARGIRLRAPQRERAVPRRRATSCSATRWASSSRYYAAADVAFVGGSLLPLGGQNLIEAIAVGTPTLVGPHTFNFADAAAQAVAARRRAARRRCRRVARGSRRASRAIPRGATACGDAALAFHAAHRRRDRSPVGVAGAAARAVRPFNRRLRSSRSCSVSVADRGLEAQHGDQVLEVGVGEVAPRREDVLLDVQHVEVGADADFLAEDVRLQRDLGRGHRLLERLHARRRAVDAGEAVLRVGRRRAAWPTRGRRAPGPAARSSRARAN